MKTENRPQRKLATCQHCGKSFQATACELNRYCSNACNAQSRSLFVDDWWLDRSKHDRAVVLLATPIRKLINFDDRPCLICSATFRARPMGSNRRTCSDGCHSIRQQQTSRDGYQRYMARLDSREQEQIDRQRVYERDRFTCQLCEQPVDMLIRWPHHDAPTIDHILPVSRGGAHTYANVQLAHWGCNLRKRDKIGKIDRAKID